jgi:hypothetical protein
MHKIMVASLEGVEVEDEYAQRINPVIGFSSGSS